MHPDLLNNPTFLRYYESWQRDPASLVFAPLAEFFCQYKLFADARRVCEAGVKHNPDSVLAHYTLAKTYTFTREWHAARHEAQWLLARIPNHEGAQEVLQKIEQSQSFVQPPVMHVDSVAGGTGGVVPERQGYQTPQTLTSLLRAAAEPQLAPACRIAASGTAPPVTGPATEPATESKKVLSWQTVTMAKIYAQQGHYFKARTIYKTILSRDPQNSEATAGLATLEKRMSDAA